MDLSFKCEVENDNDDDIGYSNLHGLINTTSDYSDY